MSIKDFCQCTPSEFQAIYHEWNSLNVGVMRRSWEQTRFISLTNVAPFSKKPLKRNDIMVFPWDNKGPQVRKGTSSYERMKEVEKRGR